MPNALQKQQIISTAYFVCIHPDCNYLIAFEQDKQVQKCLIPAMFFFLTCNPLYARALL